MLAREEMKPPLFKKYLFYYGMILGLSYLVGLPCCIKKAMKSLWPLILIQLKQLLGGGEQLDAFSSCNLCTQNITSKCPQKYKLKFN